jgi:c-di-GMP-binding flagellar brake protein YcgR
MALAAEQKPGLRALSDERRRFQRVNVDLLGRYMLPDRREFPCQVVNMSPGGMAVIAPVSAQPGERVIAYVDHLGRLEGHVARLFQNGFAMTISATIRKRDKLAAQLTWLDISQSGAAIVSDQRPQIGSLVTLGKVPGRVVRYLDDGFAIEFTRLQHTDFLEDAISGA